MQISAHDKGVETVVLGVPAQDARETFLEAFADCGCVEWLPLLELEVLNPNRICRQADRVDALADDLEPHVLENG